MPLGILYPFPECVNRNNAKNCVTNKNFDIDINDVLESIRLLLQYIKHSPRIKGRNYKDNFIGYNNNG